VTPQISRIGLWAPLWLWIQEGASLPEAAAEVDGLGFGAIWLGNGPTIMDVASSLLDATPRITVATGIVNIWVHPVEEIAGRSARLAEQHPSRLLLGLGNGPREPGQWLLSPYGKMVEYLDRLDASGCPADGRILGAVGMRMTALAAARSLGAHPFLTTVDHTRQARAILGDGPRPGPRRRPPGPRLLPE